MKKKLCTTATGLGLTLSIEKNVTNLHSLQIRNIFFGDKKFKREGCTAMQPFSDFFGQKRPHSIGRDLRQKVPRWDVQKPSLWEQDKNSGSLTKNRIAFKLKNVIYI